MFPDSGREEFPGEAVQAGESRGAPVCFGPESAVWYGSIPQILMWQ